MTRFRKVAKMAILQKQEAVKRKHIKSITTFVLCKRTNYKKTNSKKWPFCKAYIITKWSKIVQPETFLCLSLLTSFAGRNGKKTIRCDACAKTLKSDRHELAFGVQKNVKLYYRSESRSRNGLVTPRYTTIFGKCRFFCPSYAINNVSHYHQK